MAGDNYDIQLEPAAQESVAFGRLADDVATTLNDGLTQVQQAASKLKGEAVHAFSRLVAEWTQSSQTIQRSMDEIATAMGRSTKSLETQERNTSVSFRGAGSVDAGTVHTGGAASVRSYQGEVGGAGTVIRFAGGEVDEISARLQTILTRLRGQLDEAVASADRMRNVWQAVSADLYRKTVTTWENEYQDLMEVARTIRTATDDWSRTGTGTERGNQQMWA